MGEVTFEPFPKIGRWSRAIIVTEKIDGTNAQVFVTEAGDVLAGSRNRWVTLGNDNFGFAAWVAANAEDLKQLGPGRHFGEWWGSGIQRGYDMTERRFSLFNAERWRVSPLPACCHVVPTLYEGPMQSAAVEAALKNLADYGSVAAPGFMRPEGVVVFHKATRTGFKKTIERDDVPKGQAE